MILDGSSGEALAYHLSDRMTMELVTKQYITYYNHYRYQWNRKKMTPVQYRDHLLEAT